VAACGQPGQQSWLCTTVYDLTGNRRAAEIADAFAAPFRVLVILAVAFLVVRLTRLAIRRVVRRLARDDTVERLDRFRRKTGLALLDTSPVPSPRRRQRAETIGALLRSTSGVLVWATALVMVLDTFGVNLAALGVGATVLGVALGFGAQTLVRDFLSGLFMLIEDQYGVGDVVNAGPATGVVEGVSLRTTRLRDNEGTVWHIPNGQITWVGNKSQQWARALLDVAVAYDTDVDAAMDLVRRTAEGLLDDPQFRPLVLATPEVWGVEAIAADRVVIRLAVKTRPLEQWRVARELRARLKAALDAAGISPASDQVVSYRTEGPHGPSAGPSR